MKQQQCLCSLLHSLAYRLRPTQLITSGTIMPQPSSRELGPWSMRRKGCWQRVGRAVERGEDVRKRAMGKDISSAGNQQAWWEEWALLKVSAQL